MVPRAVEVLIAAFHVSTQHPSRTTGSIELALSVTLHNEKCEGNKKERGDAVMEAATDTASPHQDFSLALAVVKKIYIYRRHESGA